jgi:hypothetical protein
MTRRENNGAFTFVGWLCLKKGVYHVSIATKRKVKFGEERSETGLIK